LIGRVYGEEKTLSRRKIGPKAGRQERLLKKKGPGRGIIIETNSQNNGCKNLSA